MTSRSRKGPPPLPSKPANQTGQYGSIDRVASMTISEGTMYLGQRVMEIVAKTTDLSDRKLGQIKEEIHWDRKVKDILSRVRVGRS